MAHQPHPVEFDSPLVEIDIGLLADQVGVSSTHSLDLGQGEHDLASSINVGAIIGMQSAFCQDSRGKIDIYLRRRRMCWKEMWA
jgi:hypothetical protein